MMKYWYVAAPATINVPSEIVNHATKRLLDVDGSAVQVLRFDAREAQQRGGRELVLDVFTSSHSEAPTWIGEWRADESYW